ncbi:MAG: NAD-dependent epimerase/dehydratase family protein, partial [Pirellulaceae bacterium]
MANETVLVTGATGLLGNNVARLLLARGAAVRVLIRNGSDRRSVDGLDVEIANGDICDPASVREACEGTRAIVHAAAYVQIGRSQLALHRQTNVAGTRSLARAARDAGARLVHVSSVDALGLGSEEDPADEETPLSKPASCAYVISKREAEQVVLEEVNQGLDAVIVNPGFMLGPWDWKPSSGRMLLEVAHGRGWFAPQGNCSVCDVRDVAAGIIAAMERGLTRRQYILAGENLTYLQAWRLFAEVSDARRPIGAVGPWILRGAGLVGDVWGLLGREP